jgi:uncharacterized YccA/Bax inhibitor family protein
MVFRRGNPALNPEYFRSGMSAERMTLNGTIHKTLFLLGLIGVTGVMAYSISSQSPGMGMLMMLGGGLGGFILALVIIFTRPAQPQVLIGMYALLEGLFIGAFSFVIENNYLGGNEGVVHQAYRKIYFGCGIDGWSYYDGIHAELCNVHFWNWHTIPSH